MTTRRFSDFNSHWRDLNLTPRRQYLTRKLILAGERPVLMALLELHNGADIDAVLENYARLEPDLYAVMGADKLPIGSPTVVKGGRRR
jgi:hypothetical protein